MKTPQEIKATLARLAPSIAIRTLWTHDNDAKFEGDWTEGKRSDDWQAWESEVEVSAIQQGEQITASDYLCGTWESAFDNPWKSNPDISGYYPQMLQQALEELRGKVAGVGIIGELDRAIAMIKTEMRERYEEQPADIATR